MLMNNSLSFSQAREKVLLEEIENVEIPESPFFVDFLRDAPEPTGEEADDPDLDAPKIYEQVSILCN